MGGSAGGGKSYSLLIEALRYAKVTGFGAVIFRRTFPRITAEGALWDQSWKIYPHAGGKANQSNLTWVFPSGAKIQFAHLQHQSNLQDWHGSQICLLCFDEACEFSEKQVMYLLSRNRSTCGVRPYVRMTCNPDSESWLAGWVDWWIDQETGYPIRERSGVLRWFARDGDNLVWANSPDELRALTSPAVLPRSFTFIPAKLEDNPTLERTNPEYRANLEALPTVERERLLGGNWKIRPMAGIVFPRDKWQFCQQLPAGAKLVRYWDKASTSLGTGARTAGVLVGMVDEGPNQRFFIGDGIAGRWADLERENIIKATAEMDRSRYGWRVTTCVEREPGSGGKDSARSTIRNLAGFSVGERPARTKKHIAWKPLAAQVQAENVWIVTGDPDSPSWHYGEFIQELDLLSGDAKQDGSLLKDYADAASGGFNELTRAADFEDAVGFRVAAEEHTPLSQQEIDEMPDFLRDLVTGHTELNKTAQHGGHVPEGNW